MQYLTVYKEHNNCDAYLDTLRGQVDKELALVQPCYDKYNGSQPELAVEDCQGWEGLSDKDLSHLLVQQISHLYSGKAITGNENVMSVPFRHLHISVGSMHAHICE